MNSIINNTGFSILSYNNKDILSVFKKQSSDKKEIIEKDMSASEISEVVSEKIIILIKEQFEKTKLELESK